MKRYFLFLLVVLGVFLMGIGCDDDKKGSEFATVFGTITFENVDVWAAWTDSGEVEVTIFAEDVWRSVGGMTVPQGAPFNAQNPFVIDYLPGTASYSYTIEDLTAGTYSALAVGYRNDNITDPNLKTATLGVYWSNPDSVSHGIVVPPFFDYPAPSVIALEKGDEIELNFKADFAFVNFWYQ